MHVPAATVQVMPTATPAPWVPARLHLDTGIAMLGLGEATLDIDTRSDMSVRDASHHWAKAQFPGDEFEGAFELRPNKDEHSLMTAIVDGFRGANLLDRSEAFDPAWQRIPEGTNPEQDAFVRMRIAFEGPDGDQRQVSWHLPANADLPDGPERTLIGNLSKYMDLVAATGTPVPVPVPGS